MFRLISLLLFILTVPHSESTASVTLLITGHSSDNVYKHQLARLFVDSYDDLIKGSQAQLFAFTNGVSVPVATDSNDLLETWTDLEMPSNVTTVVVTSLGTDEMSLDHLSVLQRFMKTKKAFIVIEIGSPAIQTRVLLERSAACPLEGHALILSPNLVYFCNKAKPRMIPDLRFDHVHEVPPNFKPVREKPEKISLVSGLFASAAKAGEKKHHNLSAHAHAHPHPHQPHHDHYHHHHTGHTHHHRRHHLEEDVDQIVSQIMKEIAEESTVEKKEPEFSELPEAKKRMICKYRKSCYETGVRPKIDDDWIFYPSHWWPTKKEIEIIIRDENETEPYNAEEDLMIQKFHCKYRVSCYEQRGIPYTEKPERKEARSVLASKKKVQPGKKKTLKEIAAATLQKVEAAKEKAAKRPAIKVVQKKLTANQEKINEKLNCKYRKSCYETGQKPVFDEGWKLPISIFSTESAETISKELNYSELEELEKKVYCKYRKSCYETGVKPEIEPEFFIQTIIDLFTIHEQVETRKLSLQEKCKYRKSCYETGIVPEINPKLEAVIQKEVSSVIPTNVQDLKLLCKYRKSCYAEIHDSATVDTIKSIRKRRQIEKEVRRRKAKRAKLHHRLRGEMQLGHWRKYSRKTAYQETPQAAAEEAVKVVAEPKRAKSRRVKQSSKAKEPQPEVEEEAKVEIIEPQEEEKKEEPESEPEPEPKPEAQPEPEPEAEPEPEPEPETEPEPEPQPQPKKQRKIKRMKPEEQVDERKVKKFTPKPRTTTKTEEEFFREEQPKPGKPPRSKQEPKKKEAAKPKKVIKEEEEKQEEEEQEEAAATQPKEEAEQQAEEVDKKEEGKQDTRKTEEVESELGAKDAMQKLIEDMHHQQEVQQQKEYCKYRKSCYESGEKPKIDTTVVGVITSFGEQLEKAYEEEEEAIAKARAEIDKKLRCKYRKSCYETGILPEIKKQVEEEKHGITFKTGISKQLQCKYRKSCYKEMGITAAKDEVAETEEMRTSGEKPARPDGDATTPRAGKDGAERRTLKEIHESIKQQKHETLMKEKCRAGKACYASIEPKAINEDHAGNMARIGAQRFMEHGKCSPYYYSCRQVLGLPMPEKAPIGPNGKRLCRKKKL